MPGSTERTCILSIIGIKRFEFQRGGEEVHLVIRQLDFIWSLRERRVEQADNLVRRQVEHGVPWGPNVA